MAKNTVSQTLVWILLGLLFVSLLGIGATSFSGGGSAVARVGTADVTAEEYANALSQELRALQAQSGRAITLSEARQFGIDQVVLGRLVGAAAMSDQASAAGLSVGTGSVDREIRENPNFLDASGQFDVNSFQFVLDRNNLSPEEYSESVREDMTRQILQASLMGGISAPDAYLDALMGYIREARDVSWAEVTEADLETPIAEPTEADLAAYHEENAALFTLAEAKALTIVALTPDMIIDQMDIDEAELRDIYDEREALYNMPERRLVERLVYPDTEAAAAAKARLDAGEATFEDLVEERGFTLAEIDLGDVEARDLGDAASAVFGLLEPDVVGPAESPLGPALFRMNAIFPASSTSFEEAREDLRTEVALERARRVILDEISPVDDLLAGGATLEELADETDMTLSSLEWRPGTSEGLAAYEAIRRAAALVTEDDFPEVIELEDGGIAALRLDETVPPRLQPLADVRDVVAAAWRQQELSFALAALANDVVDGLGDDLDATGLTFTTSEGLYRDGFIDGTPPTFLGTVFEMEVGDTVVIEGPGQAFIARLDAITAPDGEDEDTARIRALLADRAAQGLANDVLIGFMQAAQASSEVEINQATINAVHAQFP